MGDRVEEFFEELGARGHDSLLDRLEGTGRFEICDQGLTEQWRLSVKGGYPSVSRGGGDADWVMRANRDDFIRLVEGKAGTIAALVRGTLQITINDPAQRVGMISRVFAGPPEARQ
jgi:hypothetical protein